MTGGDNLQALFGAINRATTQIAFTRNPAERYLRIRVLQGIDVERLWTECSKHLRLPGLTHPADKKLLEDLVAGFRARKHLRDVSKTSKNNGRPKARPIPWLDDRVDADLSEQEYMDRYGITDYVEVGPNGKKSKARAARFENALKLWVDDTSRPLVRAMIVAGKTDKEIAEEVYKICPSVLSIRIRPVDIQGVRDVLFDLSLLSLQERIVFLGKVAMDPIEVGTAISGIEAYKFRMGMSHLEIGDLHRLRVVRDVAYLRLDEMRVRPESFDHRALQVGSQVMIEAIDRIKELELELAAKSEDAVKHLKMREAEDFKPYSQVLARAQQQGNLKLVEEVFEIGGINAVDYQDLVASIEAGHPLSPSTRIMLSQRREEHYQRTQQEEVEGEAPVVGHYEMPDAVTSTAEPTQAARGGRTFDLSLKALLRAGKAS